jgi:hypothetical protein
MSVDATAWPQDPNQPPGRFEIVPPQAPVEQAEARALPEWTRRRKELYNASRDILLAHQIKPSRREGQRYDVWIYLVGRRGIQPTDVVERAEFYLGRWWGHRVLTVHSGGADGTIGIRTAAHGPALCVCRVVFKDGQEAFLDRWIDFEMSWVFDEPATGGART